MEKIRAGSGIRASEIAYCGMFAALMTVGAKLNIVLPIGTGVTISLQILFAVMAGLILGAKDGLISVLIYLVIGLFGIPVYAHGGGPAYVLKPTYGFLIGFATAAWLSGFILSRFKKKSLLSFMIAGEIGMLSYYVCGLLYFYLMSNVFLVDVPNIGIMELFTVWFLSTAGVDALIAGAGSALAARISPAIDRIRLR